MITHFTPPPILRAVLEHGADAMLLVDRQRTITGVLEDGRWGTEQLVGLKIDVWMSADVASEAIRVIEHAFATGESGIWSGDWVCADGSVGGYETRAVPVVSRGVVVLLVRDTTTERRRLREIEDRAAELQAVFESMPAYVALVDRQRRFLMINRPDYGLTEDDLLRLRVDDLTLPEHLDVAIAAIERTFETGEVTTYEARGQLPDGSEMWALTRCARIARSGGEARVVLAVSDVTDQKRTEHALRHSQSRFQTLFEHLPDFATTVDRNRHLVATNRIPAGASLDAIRHRQVDEFVDPVDHAALRDAIEHTFATGTSMTYQVGAIHPAGGERREIFTRTALLPTVRGEEPEVLLLSYDVTERVVHERALRESEHRYRTLAENLPDFVTTLDRDRRFRTFNRLLDGFTAEQVLASRIEDVNEPETAPTAIAAVNAAFATGKPAEYETRLFHDGRDRWFKNRIVPIGVIDGEERVLCITTDVTDARTAMDGLREQLALREQLQQAQKMEAIGQLAGGIAHDFNNLLLVLQSHLEFIRVRTERDPLVRPELDVMESAVQRAAELTRQLLAVGRQQPIQVRPVSVGALLDEVIRLVRRTFPSSILLQQVAETGTLAVAADAGQLQQVLINLSINARDAMPDGGVLRYEVARATGVSGRAEVRLTVRDTGRAMSPEVRERIFEPFYTTKGTQGSGLGLAMVDGIVRQHDGRIEVESTPGIGSAFHVYLLATDAPVEPVPRAVVPIGATATILVAEDDPMVRSVVSRVLREAGYEIIEACDGLDAVHLFETNADRITLVLADVMMPRLTGREVYDRLAPGYPQTRFLFTSGYSAELLGDGFLDRQGIQLLQKPYRLESLLAKVREVLAQEPAMIAR